MKRVRTTLFLLSPVFTISAAVVPLVNFRSQGVNAARELVGLEHKINYPHGQHRYGCFFVAAEFSKSFDDIALSRYLFNDTLYCTCQDATFYVQGSQVVNRHANALMADQFYLPTDFESRVTIHPSIKNGIVDFGCYWGLDSVKEGLYLRAHFPVVHTRWNLNFCEEGINPGHDPYDPGYFNDLFVPDNYLDPAVHGLERSKMLVDFSDYIINGSAIAGVPGITYQGLANARICNGALSKTGIAEFTAALGWNFRLDDRHHVGLQLRAAAPTGNKPEGYYLFEPIVGNGKHPVIGGGLTCHWCLWQSEDEQCECAIYSDVNVTHFFRVCQRRTFDLVCKPLSRYMLAMRFTDEVHNLAGVTGRGDFVEPQQQFAKEFVPLANITTLPVYSSVPVQVDAVLDLAYSSYNFTFEIGYNLWARSCEKLWRKTDWCSESLSNTYGLKGNAFVFGFASVENPFAIENPGIPLSATESDATIFAGTNTIIPGAANNGIDCPVPAYNGTMLGNQPLYVHTTEESWQKVNTTFPGPELINESDFDLEGAQTSGISNKLFIHFNYTWREACHQPFVGIGGESEWGISQGFKRHECQLDCKRCSLSQWGIWFKGGLSF